MCMMKTKRSFVVSLVVAQVILVFIAFLIVNSLVGFASAQTAPYDQVTAWVLGIAAAAAIIGSTLAAAIVIKSVGTAAISALTENEGVFFKAFLVITLGEALAIFGLIVAILLWIRIPTPGSGT